MWQIFEDLPRNEAFGISGILGMKPENDKTMKLLQSIVDC